MNHDLAPNSTPPLDFDQFMASLRDSESVAPIVSARRFAAALHIDMQTLAKLAHVHRNALPKFGDAPVAGMANALHFDTEGRRIRCGVLPNAYDASNT
ncbi:hypothetical protein [Burkholderia contaminans]|uniref:hypothetical protein n=1 Tax=Burkholderia contaminans TaxID=488447 RepID=UPI0039897D43